MMKKLFLTLFLLLVSFLSYSFANSSLDQAISWMNQNGLTKFTGAQDFMATQSLRRDEASKFFVQYAEKIQKSIFDETKTECDKFTDLNKGWSDLTGTIAEACKLGLFKGANGKFMPSQPLTNAQAITVVMRMIDGTKDETQGYFAQKYFEKAQELGIMNGLNLNSTANFEQLATRGDVAILLFNASNLTGITLNNQDFAYIDNQIKTINQKFKLDSKARQDYIDSLYDKEDTQGNKDKLITSKIIEKLEEKTTTVYLSGFRCNILNIESMIGGGWVTGNNQIIGINLNCKNISSNDLMPKFGYAISDKSSSNSKAYVYTNIENLKDNNGYKISNFFGNSDIQSGTFDVNTAISPGGTVQGWILTEIPQMITKIKYTIMSQDGIDFGTKRIELVPITLKSTVEQRRADADVKYNAFNEGLKVGYKQCLDAGASKSECKPILDGVITKGISDLVFSIINLQLTESGYPSYGLTISDSYLGDQYCKQDSISYECALIRNGKVQNITTVYH